MTKVKYSTKEYFEKRFIICNGYHEEFFWEIDSVEMKIYSIYQILSYLFWKYMSVMIGNMVKQKYDVIWSSPMSYLDSSL